MTLREGGNYQDMIAADVESEVEPVQQRATTSWVHSHPYIATIITACVLVFFGALFFIQRLDVDPASSSGAWGGAGGMFFSSTKNAPPKGVQPQDVLNLQSTSGSYSVIPIYETSDEGEVISGVNDITELLAQLVQPVSSGDTVPETTPGSYTFIPQGLIRTEPQKIKLTATQAALKEYGNQVGTYIKGFEDLHYGSAQILKDHVEDRTHVDKQRAIKILGADMQQLGRDLAALPGIPKDVQASHKEYALAYYKAGSALIKVANTTTDEEFIEALLAYNAAVEALTTRFVAVVTLFQVHEVTFSSSDQGNIFMFTGNLSLFQQ